MTRHLLTLCAALTLLALLAPPAAAQITEGEGGGSSGGDTVTVGVIVGESFPGHPGGGPGSNRSTGRTGGTNLVTYYWRGPLPGSGCPGLGAEIPGMVVPNDRYERVRHDRTTEPPTITVLETTCFPPEAAPEVEPEPPPAPPTMAEITALAQQAVVAPAVGVSPGGDGLTGLETRFWYEGETALEVSASIRGYTVVATMRPTMYHWHTGEGVVSTTAAGSAAAPAVRWVYETKGGYRVLVQAEWNGGWRFAGWGATAEGDLATIRATGARDYTVNEVRSVLTG